MTGGVGELREWNIGDVPDDAGADGADGADSIHPKYLRTGYL